MVAGGMAERSETVKKNDNFNRMAAPRNSDTRKIRPSFSTAGINIVAVPPERHFIHPKNT